MDAVQLVQRVERDASQVLLFKVSDTCPSGQAFWEGPAVNREADASQDGDTGIVGTPESGWKRVNVSER